MPTFSTDKCLQDITYTFILFIGSKTILLGVDNRPVFLIILQTTLTAILDICLKHSLLWLNFRQCYPAENMQTSEEWKVFTHWLPHLGNGTNHTHTHTHTHIYIYMYVCLRIFIYTYIHTFMDWLRETRSRRDRSTPTAVTFLTDKDDVGQADTVAEEGLIRIWWHSIAVPPFVPFVSADIFKIGNNLVGGEKPSVSVLN